MPPKGKQGTKGQKQILEENKSTLNFYRNIIVAVNAVYFVINYVFFWDQFTTLSVTMSCLVLAVYFGSYRFMASMGRATYSEGTLVDSGIDLNMESGMAE
nr:hypothetical protein BaRGS_003849 [Batillaria attramentaria]